MIDQVKDKKKKGPYISRQHAELRERMERAQRIRLSKRHYASSHGAR